MKAASADSRGIALRLRPSFVVARLVHHDVDGSGSNISKGVCWLDGSLPCAVWQESCHDGRYRI
jgi:hypothetical protein